MILNVIAHNLIPDAEMRTIIDKLAEFVARNGPEFENVTKKKQLTNPKFSFLYGGEHFAYYRHRVTIEQRSEYIHIITSMLFTHEN